MKNVDPTPCPRAATRRDFLRASAKAAASVSLAGLSVHRMAHAAGSDILRVGMIGAGGRNTGAGAQALQADRGTRLVAICDIFLDRVKAARASIRSALAEAGRPEAVQVPDEHCLTGFAAYQQVIELSDVVCIANAAKFHPLHTLAAIQAGRHVFVEKPHGIDPYTVRMMREACHVARQKGLSVASGLHSRHHPGYAETIARVRDGAIGDIISIEENFLRAPYGITERRPGLTELQWQCSTQYHFCWLSGDDVPQSLVHNMDRARWALQEAVPAKCHGLGGRSSMTEPVYGDVFDHHSVVYEFEGGVRVYAFCRTTTGCHDDSSSQVLGAKGRANITACHISGETNWRWQPPSRDPHRVDPYQIEHDRLFAGIRAGTPVNNGDYLVDSTMTTVMGQISCYTGKEIGWDQVNASDYFHCNKPEDCHDGMAPPVAPGPDGRYSVPVPGKTRML